MLAPIPNHPITCGTTPEVTNTIEKASVPIDHRIIANLNLVSFALKVAQAKSLNEALSAPLEPEYCPAMLISPQ